MCRRCRTCGRCRDIGRDSDHARHTGFRFDGSARLFRTNRSDGGALGLTRGAWRPEWYIVRGIGGKSPTRLGDVRRLLAVRGAGRAAGSGRFGLGTGQAGFAARDRPGSRQSPRGIGGPARGSRGSRGLSRVAGFAAGRGVCSGARGVPRVARCAAGGEVCGGWRGVPRRPIRPAGASRGGARSRPRSARACRRVARRCRRHARA